MENWWEQTQNKSTLDLPVSIINDNNVWVICSNEKTKELLGDEISSIIVQGKSKEDAIRKYFLLIKSTVSHQQLQVLKYQRWVPFRKGFWNITGGTWFVIFGIVFYFRYGKNMKYGFYVPYTKLNISIRNEWKEYKKFKNELKNKNHGIFS